MALNHSPSTLSPPMSTRRNFLKNSVVASAAAALPLLVYVLYAPGHAPPTAVSAGTLLAAILVIMKHRGNIERLMAGTEPRRSPG